VSVLVLHQSTHYVAINRFVANAGGDGVGRTPTEKLVAFLQQNQTAADTDKVPADLPFNKKPHHCLRLYDFHS
jgi:hypothetical protein